MKMKMKMMKIMKIMKKMKMINIMKMMKMMKMMKIQSSIKCGTAGPAVLDSDGPSSIIKGPNIRSFVAKSVLSRFTRFLGVRTQPLTVKVQTKHCQIGQYMINIDWTDFLSIEQIFYR